MSHGGGRMKAMGDLRTKYQWILFGASELDPTTEDARRCQGALGWGEEGAVPKIARARHEPHRQCDGESREQQATPHDLELALKATEATCCTGMFSLNAETSKSYFLLA